MKSLIAFAAFAFGLYLGALVGWRCAGREIEIQEAQMPAMILEIESGKESAPMYGSSTYAVPVR